MKKKLVSLVLCTAMAAAALAGCGGGGSTASTSTGGSTGGSAASTSTGGETTADGEYVLSTLNIIVDGTITATVDAGQADFVAQWEKAVSEKLGHDIKLNIT